MPCGPSQPCLLVGIDADPALPPPPSPSRFLLPPPPRIRCVALAFPAVLTFLWVLNFVGLATPLICEALSSVAALLWRYGVRITW